VRPGWLADALPWPCAPHSHAYVRWLRGCCSRLTACLPRSPPPNPHTLLLALCVR
jgi:hypothetical protein